MLSMNTCNANFRNGFDVHSWPISGQTRYQCSMSSLPTGKELAILLSVFKEDKSFLKHSSCFFFQEMMSFFLAADFLIPTITSNLFC